MAGYINGGRRGPSHPLPGERRRCGGGAGAAFSMRCEVPSNAQLRVRDRKIETLRQERDDEACRRKQVQTREWDMESEVAGLRKQLASRDEALAILRKEMDQAAMVRAQLQTAVQSQQARLEQQERARSSHAPAHGDPYAATVAAASAVVDRLRSEKAAMRAHAAFAVDAVQDGAERLADRELALWEVARQKEALEAKLREALAEVSRLTSARDAAESAAAAARAEATRVAGAAAARPPQLPVDSVSSKTIDGLRQDLEGLRHDLQVERSASELLRRERDDAQEALRKSRSTEVAADEARSALRRELDAAGVRAAESTAEARRVAVAAASLDQEAMQLRQELHEAQAQVQTLRAEIAQMSRGLEAAETLASRRETEISSLRCNLEVANQRLTALHAQSREHRDARDEVDGRAALLEAQVSKLSAESQERERLVEEKAKLTADVQLVKDELHALKAKLKQAEVDSVAKLEERRQIDDDLKRQQESNAWLRNTCMEKDSRISALQTELDAQALKHVAQLEKIGGKTTVDNAARMSGA